MNLDLTWHTQVVEQLGRFFNEDLDAKAFILSGSLATDKTQVDVWSDLDVKIILADHALDRYYSSTSWLSPFGRLIGAERYENDVTKALRVCLENFHRFDLTFIAESVLEQPSLQKKNLFPLPYVVMWSKLQNIDKNIASLSFPIEYRETSRKELERIADEFWFKASIAIAKIVRNDLLIGMHLALDLARDNLVLQMLRRDREKKTTVHRFGGWGNELVTRFTCNDEKGTGEEILRFVRLSCEVFDELASELWPGYEQRGPLLFPTIELAKKACNERTRAGQ